MYVYGKKLRGGYPRREGGIDIFLIENRCENPRPPRPNWR
jgi:hypothetical protein